MEPAPATMQWGYRPRGGAAITEDGASEHRHTATVSAETVTSWSDDVDVTVIGFGIAGGCAAVSAAP